MQLKSSHYFIGIQLDDDIKQWLRTLQKQCQSQGYRYNNWVHPNDFHITLQFLGPVQQSTLEQWIHKLKTLHDWKAFSLVIGGFGHFGKQSQPRVLWVDVEKTNSLQMLYEDIQSLAHVMNHPSEKRPFHPHITLAKKWKDPNVFIQEDEITQTTEKKWIKVHKVALFEIHPNQQPKYAVIQEIQLKS
ncbi:ABC transporter permease [Gracilibacillus halophilus YIM-C55.5]|uniref:RNA 2',3'-cyclic phosphodiesterase n=1 Tax=Gracilibacillus halophilus YIM-C55.5 TaxID=1308866 RepID=N4WI00_9BACI|nr:RNA 2',3'-cyclic phosphodiesterase [Gracilibacillus halophilus]ENH95802.1 ABC transporter permease [Gracilibacillus halophilus YIM-C55.5]